MKNFPLILSIILSFAATILGIGVMYQRVMTTLLWGNTSTTQKQNPASLVTPKPTLTPTPTPIPLPPIVPGERALHVPVLLYHYIGDNPNPVDKARDTLSTPPDIFTQQLKLLHDNGYTSITLDDLAGALDGASLLPSNPVVLTFDDGYVDFYYNAFPLLASFGMKATVFIPTGLMGGGAYMSWPQVEEISRSPLVTIAAHSVSHVTLPAQGADRLKQEIEGSKQVLEQHIGKPVRWFAYPYGYFNDRVVRETKNAGFMGAATTLPGLVQYKSRIFYIPRYRAGRRLGEDFLRILR